MSHLILVTDYTWPSTEPEAAVLRKIGGRLRLAKTGSEEELARLARDADAILTCFADVTGEVIRNAPRLQVIGRYGIGVDNIAVDEATRRGILVTNVPRYCVDEVATHTLALLLALARHVCNFDRAVRADDWRLDVGSSMSRLSGAVLGIVGFGKIGQTVARKAQALDFTIIATDPTLADDDIRRLGAEPASLEELARLSDFVSLHTPLTSTNSGLIDGRFLELMKPTAFLINTARGGLVDQSALVDALSAQTIAGAGLDVVTPERLPPDHPLLTLPNVIVTPHVAFYSQQSVLDLETLAAQNVADVLSGQRPTSVVNPDVLDLPRWKHLTPKEPG